MRRTRCYFKNLVASVCRLQKKENSYVYLQKNPLISTDKRYHVVAPYYATTVACFYSSDSKKHFITLEKKAEAIKDAFDHKREKLKDTEQKIRLKGEELVSNIKHQKEITGERLRARKDHLIKDILETKAKVKERIEEVVEVCFVC